MPILDTVTVEFLQKAGLLYPQSSYWYLLWHIMNLRPILIKYFIYLSVCFFICMFAAYLPIQTSPNWPAPNLFTIFNVSLGISHSSWAQGLWGAEDLQGLPSLWHKPSADPTNIYSTGQVKLFWFWVVTYYFHILIIKLCGVWTK